MYYSSERLSAIPAHIAKNGTTDNTTKSKNGPPSETLSFMNPIEMTNIPIGDNNSVNAPKINDETAITPNRPKSIIILIDIIERTFVVLLFDFFKNFHPTKKYNTIIMTDKTAGPFNVNGS
jgi:hypothetical protein